MSKEIELVGRADDGKAHLVTRLDGVQVRICDGDNSNPSGGDMSQITDEPNCAQCIQVYGEDSGANIIIGRLPRMRINYEVS